MTDYTSYSSNISLSGLSKTSKIFQIDYKMSELSLFKVGMQFINERVWVWGLTLGLRLGFTLGYGFEFELR